MDERSLEAVLAKLDDVLTAFPSAAGILFERARALVALRRDGEAEAAYLAALAAEPSSFRALNDLGLLYHRYGLATEAERCFQRAVESEPANATGHANLGAMILARGDDAAALTQYERALALRPDHADAASGLAVARERLGISAEPVPDFPSRDVDDRPAPPLPIAPGLAGDPVAEYVFEIAATAIVRGDHDAADRLVNGFFSDPARAVTLWWSLADFASQQRKYVAARCCFERALALDPENAQLHIGLAIVHEEMGDIGAADAAWNGRLRGTVRVFPYTGSGRPARVLTIASALHSLRYELFADPALIHNTVLYTQAYVQGDRLPEHDVVFVAVADVESDARALATARDIVAQTSAPVINHPDRILATSRVTQAHRLALVDNVLAPRVVQTTRERLTQPDALAYVTSIGFSFPLLLRSPGFHNGRFFEYVERADDVRAVAAAMPTADLLMIAYADTRSSDGMMRKYRVMSIDGTLYPVHLAISPRWKVHYVSSSMRENEAFRAEEAHFLADMTAAIGARNVSALAAIADVLALDYGGIDFGIDRDGRLVVFEANGAMAIFLPNDDRRWDYRRGAMTAALHAATTMIVEHAATGASVPSRYRSRA